MKLYLSGTVHHLPRTEAYRLLKKFGAPSLVKKEKDGTYSIIRLSYNPLQPGQVPYTG